MSALSPLPVLREDGSSLDWRDGSYEADMTIDDAGRSATIVHRLRGCDTLSHLVDDGRAVWLTEVRCPRTLFNEAHTARQSPPVAHPVTQRVSWPASQTVGNVYLVPSLVAAREFTLPHDGLLSAVWPEGGQTVVPAGWRLVQGLPALCRSLAVSLLQFVRNQDLTPGRMRVEESTDGDSPRFMVHLADGLFQERRWDRDLQVAALIAVCARLPRSSLAAGGSNADHQLGELLRTHLRNRGVECADWNHPDWDAAEAATAMEPLLVPSETPENGDE